MGAAAAPLAVGSSIASIGMSFASASQKMDAAGAQLQAGEYSAAGVQMQAQGTQASDNYQADRAEEAAKFGRLQANLTDTTMRETLNVTLANIDAIRATGNVDPRSPTGAAVEQHDADLSDRQRIAALVTARSQAADDEASAAYLRKAGEYALLQGNIGAQAVRLGAKATAGATQASAYSDIASGLGNLSKGASAMG